MALVLASKSPRRKELMALVAPSFVVDEAQVDEQAAEAPSAAALAELLAAEKAGWVARRRSGDVVIGCDTVVEVQGRVLGKPKDPQQAAEMLQLLAGGQHVVHTGVCVVHFSGEVRRFVESTNVIFADIPKAEVEKYVLTNEPYDKAGGYAIQGWAAKYITGIHGCFYNVMGLPVAQLYAVLNKLGAV